MIHYFSLRQHVVTLCYAWVRRNRPIQWRLTIEQSSKHSRHTTSTRCYSCAYPRRAHFLPRVLPLISRRDCRRLELNSCANKPTLNRAMPELPETHVVFMDEMAVQLIALSCFSIGYSTLVHNLIRTVSPPQTVCPQWLQVRLLQPCLVMQP